MSKLKNVFYSGGFDTTSYLLDCLVVQKIKVQPIVVKVKFIDGATMRRESYFHEEVSRQNFYDKFKKKYPELSDNLLPEIVYKDVTTLDDDTLDIGKRAHKLGFFSRDINQLLYFHQVCKDNKIESVVGYVKDDGVSDNGKLFWKDEFKFTTPMMDTTKHELLDKAQKYGYDEFLYETWSCWNPQRNNVQCGKCELCKITIVDSKLYFDKNRSLI